MMTFSTCEDAGPWEMPGDKDGDLQIRSDNSFAKKQSSFLKITFASAMSAHQLTALAGL